jgi:hypothetical protein
VTSRRIGHYACELSALEEYVDRPAGIYHWHRLLSVLASPSVTSWLGELGFDSDDIGISARAACASERIDLVLGDEGQRRRMTPTEFRAASIRALQAALEELTPGEQETFLDIGSYSHDYGVRAFAWGIALRGVCRHPEDTPSVLSKQHVDQVRAWVADNDRQIDDRDYDYTLDDDDEEDAIQSTLAALLRIVWFRRVVAGFVRWPMAQRAALVGYAQQVAPAASIAKLLDATNPTGSPQQ